MSIPCKYCPNDAIAFESGPISSGYVCRDCKDNDPEMEHTYLEEE